jgi:cyclic-di-GMP-binding protein
VSSVPPAPVRPGELAFADARGCKEWLGALPLTNIPQALSMVLEQLQGLNASAFGPLERLKSLELMRDKISFLQGEQRSRYFGKTIPLSPNDSNAWTTGRTLLEEMEAGYRRCLADARASGGEAAQHEALIAQRLMRYIGTQMLFHALVYRRFDPPLWTKLHGLYAEAESRGVHSQAVKDSLEAEAGASSVADAYAQVVLLQAAFLSEMNAPQIDFAEALLRLWSRKVQILAAPAEADARRLDALVIDPAKPIGARPQPRPDFQAGQRILETDALSKSIRRRIHGLQAGEEVATLGLPPQTANVDPLVELKRLHKLWCEGAPPRPAPKPSNTEKAGLVFGVGDIHFFVSGGKAFEQPDKKRELTSQEKQDIEVFGRVREQTSLNVMAQTQGRGTVMPSVTVESWAVVDEMLGAVRVQRPPTSSKGIAIGRIVALRMGDSAPFFLGWVSELVQETDGRLIATISVLPGKPETIAVRAGDLRNRPTTQWTQALRLPPIERLQIPATLVLPSGLGHRGRGVDVWVNGAAKESTVEEILEHGTDFDRVTVF